MLNNIEAERARMGLTKEGLSKKLNVSLNTYYNWLNEKTDIPSSKLREMSLLFDVNAGYLIGLERERR